MSQSWLADLTQLIFMIKGINAYLCHVTLVDKATQVWSRFLSDFTFKSKLQYIFVLYKQFPRRKFRLYHQASATIPEYYMVTVPSELNYLYVDPIHLRGVSTQCVFSKQLHRSG